MSDKWTTNDGDFTNDIVTIKVNGTTWDVADTYARSQLLLKIDAPEVAGTAGQVLSLTADGTVWIDAPSNNESIEYSAGEGLSLTDTTFSVDWNTVAKKTDIANYTAGRGISISDGVISCTLSVPTNYVTKATFNNTIGDINSILDDINGEVL